MRSSLVSRVLVVVLVVAGSGLLGCEDQRRTEKREYARRATAEMQVRELQKMVDLYRTTNARVPRTWDELFTKDASGKSYLDADEPPTDPWGHEYRFVAGGRPGDMFVASDGPDGKPGTGDDIATTPK